MEGKRKLRGHVVSARDKKKRGEGRTTPGGAVSVGHDDARGPETGPENSRGDGA